MTFTKRCLAALSVAVMALTGGALVATSPAQARVETCVGSEQEYCLHDTATDTNPFMKWVPEDMPRNQCQRHSPWASYIRNYSPFRIWIYTGFDCTGTRGVIYPNSQGSMNTTFNNTTDGSVRTSQLSRFIGPERPALDPAKVTYLPGSAVR